MGGVAHEHGKLIKKLMRELIEPALASRLSAMLVNHRVILETLNAEKLIADLTEQVEQLKALKGIAPRRVASNMPSNMSKQLAKLQKDITALKAEATEPEIEIAWVFVEAKPVTAVTAVSTAASDKADKARA